MNCCLNLKTHATRRITLRNLSHALLGTQPEVIREKNIPSNALSLIEPAIEFDRNASADFVIQNATFISEPTQRYCVAVKGESIIFSGPLEQARAYVGDDTTIIDAEGRTLIPGFCDSHVHLMVAAERFQGLDVEDARTPNEFKRRVKAFAAERKDLPALHVYGLHYMNPPILPADKARVILDELVHDRPLFVYAHDLHTGWANSKAIEIAKIPRVMPPFPRIIEELKLEKNIELDADGAPTGEFREPDVYFLIEGPLRETFPLTVERKLAFLRDVFKELSSLGITSVHNMGLALPEEDIELLLLLLELERRGQLPVRVHCAYSIVPDEHMLSDIYYAALIRDKLREARAGSVSSIELHQFLVDTLIDVARLRHRRSDELELKYPELKGHKHLPFLHGESKRLQSSIYAAHVAPSARRLKERFDTVSTEPLDARGMVSLGGVKIFMDGVIEKDTAFRLDEAPGEGVPAFRQKDLERVARDSDRAGLRIAAHCIGDGSVKAMLDAISVARKANADVDTTRGHQIRHRIEHIEMIAPDDISRFAELNVTPSMQPLHERPPTTMWHQKVPREKWPAAFAWKSLLNTGARLCFGSDWPIVPCDCLKGMGRTVNRAPWGDGMPDQHLSKSETIDAFSASPAYLEYWENVKGQLREGMLADIVLLSDNIHDVDVTALDYVKACRTYSGGRLVYQRED